MPGSRTTHPTDSTSPLISVVMPLYNGGPFVEAAIESVCAQSYGHWELIVVDDGSNDDGMARARSWAARDARIRVLQHPGGANRGVSETRNLAIRESSGPWIALLDCDDVWLPGKIERQVSIIGQRPDLTLLYGKAQVIDDEGRLVSATTEKLRRPQIFGNGSPDQAAYGYHAFLTGEYWAPASSVMFPRAAAAACGNFEPLPYQVEDTLLLLRLSAMGPIWFSDEVLVYYRVHGGQWNSANSPSRKAAGRFCYLERLAATVGPSHRQITQEALVEFGLGGLTRALISAWEIRPGRLLAYTARVLRSPHVSGRLKARAVTLVTRRLTRVPVQGLLRLRAAARGDSATSRS